MRAGLVVAVRRVSTRGTPRAVRATAAAAVTPETMFPMPQTAVEAVKQAAQAIQRGLDAKLTRQQVLFRCAPPITAVWSTPHPMEARRGTTAHADNCL